MTASTRDRVAGATSERPFSTRETVGTETPASSAMDAIVARSTAQMLPEAWPKLPKSCIRVDRGHCDKRPERHNPPRSHQIQRWGRGDRLPPAFRVGIGTHLGPTHNHL